MTRRDHFDRTESYFPLVYPPLRTLYFSLRFFSFPQTAAYGRYTRVSYSLAVQRDGKSLERKKGKDKRRQNKSDEQL